jgi:hypothetical protein
MKPKDILKIFNKEWPKVDQEQRKMYAQIASRMGYDPIRGVRPQTFNGIQQYKELLGFPTRVNPRKVEPKTIHKEKIDPELLTEIKNIKAYIR